VGGASPALRLKLEDQQSLKPETAMQIILLERVPKLGQMGEVVSVRDGFARNFLIPRGKALRATKGALDDFAQRRQQLEARNLELKEEAQKAATQVDGRSVVILRQASESAQLYGSVSSRDVAEAFTAAGVNLSRQQIRLEQPLKTLGLHEVPVALHPEVEVTVKVNVARSPEEADVQAGVARPASEEEAEEQETPLDAALEAVEEA
jgi:large subunit ribosomal protein L9